MPQGSDRRIEPRNDRDRRRRRGGIRLLSPREAAVLDYTPAVSTSEPSAELLQKQVTGDNSPKDADRAVLRRRPYQLSDCLHGWSSSMLNWAANCSKALVPNRPQRARRAKPTSRKPSGIGIWWGMLWLVDHPVVFFVTTLTLLIASARVGVAASAHGRTLASADRVEFDLVRNAMFTLLGLMVGFARSMAVSRYDLRKSLEEAEANAIGTEYLRLDLMPPETTTAVRALLRTYVDERIAFYRDHDPKKQENSDAATIGTMKALWAAIAREVNARQKPTDALVASGMNDILNSEGYTLAAWRNRLPIEVWMLLILIAAACNFLIGFGAKRLSPATDVILPVTAALAFLLIADVEGPRNGFVQVEPVDLEDVATAMS